MIYKYFVLFIIKVQQFSFMMKIIQDIDDDAVYVNMIGQSPNFSSFPKNNFKIYITDLTSDLIHNVGRTNFSV